MTEISRQRIALIAEGATLRGDNARFQPVLAPQESKSDPKSWSN